MVIIDDSTIPHVLCEENNVVNVTAALHKIGRSEALSLIRQIYASDLRTHGDALLLQFINQGFSNTVVLRLCVGRIRGGSVVPALRLIAKIGRYESVSEEVRNYNELIRPMGITFAPHLLGFRDMIKRWAVLLYEDIADSKTYHDVYTQTDDPVQCIRHIDTTFTHLEATWLRRAVLTRTNLFTEQFKLVKHISRYQEANSAIVPEVFNRERVTVHVPAGELTLLNPVYHLLAGVPYSDHVTHVATVHGDMHSENILVNETSGAVHLIDFANMESAGHVFKDYVKLEANLLFRLMDYDASQTANAFAPEWLALIAELLGHGVVSAPGVEIVKARECIRRLRHRARDLKCNVLSSDKWQEEYLIGLLHWTLSSIYWIDIFPSKKQLAFYAACLIGDAIDKVRQGETVLAV